MSSDIEPRIKTVEEAMRTLTQLAVSAGERTDTHEQWINELGAAQVELTKAQARTEAALAETNERLNTLINVFERHPSEGRNGSA
jgi:ABC-type transporter Mla subunit MlaD